MADPVEWAGVMASRYGATAAGLMIGTAAKYGLTLTEGRRLTWRGFLGDMLLLGMLGLLALVITDSLALTGNAKVLVGALAAVSSDRLVRLARERFLRRVEASLKQDVVRTKGELRNLVQTDLSARNLLNDAIEVDGLPHDMIEQLRLIERNSE